MHPIFFGTSSAFRTWLKDNHTKTSELIVGFYKINSGKISMTWSESVDEALCFGWIDGVRKSLDDESYTIRFTPRKPSSIWSAVNIAKVEKLTELGLMQQAGLEIFKKRKEHKSRVYSFENTEMQLSQKYEELFRANQKAWTYFQNLAPGYRKNSLHYIMSAKWESTRMKRLMEIICLSESGVNPWKDNKYSKKAMK